MSSTPRHTLYINRAKDVLVNHEVAVLHGLGDSTVNVVRAADSLRLGYATLTSFITDTVMERMRTCKAVVRLTKTKNFVSFKKEYYDSREAPEYLIDKKA
jgi:urease gamma subunit